MIDIVERWKLYVESMGSVMGEVEHLADEMAKEIERLREENKSLRDECRGLENSINRILND